MIFKDAGAVFTIEFEPKDWHYGRADSFRDKMKAEVPKEARLYDPESKIWTIDQNFRDVVRSIYDDHFKDTRQETLF